MSWPDNSNPQLPFKKPRQIEKIEEMTYDQREAMDGQERKDRISEAANVLAKTYQKKVKSADYEGCVLLTDSALKTLGYSLGGSFGANMVGMSKQASIESCKQTFLNEEEQQEL